MYLQLKFNNPTPGSTVNIYRGDAELDRANLSNPVATLSNGETTWRDNNVVRGKFYYYVFETVLGTDKVSTINFRIQATVRRGAGPSAIQMGDGDYGYYGSIESSEFINGTDLAGRLGFSGGASTTNVITWHKWVRNGKILYVPNGPLRSAISWKMLYEAGLVFGVDGPGPYNAQSGDFNQKKTVTIGPDTYLVRLMRGYNDDYSVFPPGTTVNEPMEAFTCEWDDLLYPLYQFVPAAQRMANVASYTREQMRLQNQYANWVQEKPIASGSQAIRRGNAVTGRGSLSTRVPDTLTGAGSPYGWWPVLELIES